MEPDTPPQRSAYGVVIALLLAVVLLGGCASGRESGDPRETAFYAFSPLYTETFHGVSEEKVATFEEVLQDAKDAAKENGVKGHLRCVFRYFDDPNHERDVIVDPLTIENLKASGVQLKDVEWVVLHGEQQLPPRTRPK